MLKAKQEGDSQHGETRGEAEKGARARPHETSPYSHVTGEVRMAEEKQAGG
jgi:hypothetical protein